jgi:HPt (histidine-containing phosphotransfer) domain-containing protein
MRAAKKAASKAIGDAELKALADGYLERRRLAMDGLKRALATADYETLWIEGHHMRGAGGSFGVDRISELGAEIELSAWERDGAGVAEKLKELEDFLAQVALR